MPIKGEELGDRFCRKVPDFNLSGCNFGGKLEFYGKDSGTA